MSKKSRVNPIAAEKLISLDGIIEILDNPKKLFWLNFKAGFIRGFAGILGAALAIIIIGFLVARLGGVPLIGDIINQIGDAVKPAN